MKFTEILKNNLQNFYTIIKKYPNPKAFDLDSDLINIDWTNNEKYVCFSISPEKNEIKYFKYYQNIHDNEEGVLYDLNEVDNMLKWVYDNQSQ
jgi:hypothetical protein